MSYTGTLGSKTDGTWDPTIRRHTCCNSRFSSYHHKGCTAKLIDGSINPAMPPELITIRELKHVQGLNSAQVAQMIGLPLRQVNRLYPQV